MKTNIISHHHIKPEWALVKIASNDAKYVKIIYSSSQNIPKESSLIKKLINEPPLRFLLKSRKFKFKYDHFLAPLEGFSLVNAPADLKMSLERKLFNIDGPVKTIVDKIENSEVLSSYETSIAETNICINFLMSLHLRYHWIHGFKENYLKRIELKSKSMLNEKKPTWSPSYNLVVSDYFITTQVLDSMLKMSYEFSQNKVVKFIRLSSETFITGNSFLQHFDAKGRIVNREEDFDNVVAVGCVVSSRIFMLICEPEVSLQFAKEKYLARLINYNTIRNSLIILGNLDSLPTLGILTKEDVFGQYGREKKSLHENVFKRDHKLKAKVKKFQNKITLIFDRSKSIIINKREWPELATLNRVFLNQQQLVTYNVAIASSKADERRLESFHYNHTSSLAYCQSFSKHKKKFLSSYSFWEFHFEFRMYSNKDLVYCSVPYVFDETADAIHDRIYFFTKGQFHPGLLCYKKPLYSDNHTPISNFVLYDESGKMVKEPLTEGSYHSRIFLRGSRIVYEWQHFYQLNF